jgi:hypothetical protein
MERDSQESVDSYATRRALDELRALNTKFEERPKPVPAIPPKPFQMTGERDEALQGAIAALRSLARRRGESNANSRRMEEWADILEEMWEELR